MRAIGLNLVILTFCLSTLTFGVDAVILSPLGISPTTLDGTTPVDVQGLTQSDRDAFGNLASDSLNPQYQGEVIDRITLFSTGGFDAVWTMITLLSGSYYLNWAVAVGVPEFWIYLFQGVMAFAVVITVIKYVRGVE